MTLKHVFIIVAIAILAPFIWLPFATPPDAADRQSTAPAGAGAGLPWQIDMRPDGLITVLGLTPRISTLHDASALFGDEPDLALILPRDESPTLEAYWRSVHAGFITGRLLLTSHLDDARIAAMVERAGEPERMENSAMRRARLASGDLPEAMAAPIRAITFIPTAELDADVISTRFGPAASTREDDGGMRHFLYPERGLSISLAGNGDAVLQYVAPADFDRLLDDGGQPAVDAAPDAGASGRDDPPNSPPTQ